MPLILAGIAGLVGLFLGILINSLADNLPPDAEDRRYPPRRPRCRNCGHVFPPIYWLALAHWLWRGGRCPHCGARRPLRPLVVELASAAALAYLWVWAGGAADGLLPEVIRFAGGATVALVFILIVVIDMEHRLILWVVVWPAAIVIGLLGIITPGHGLVKTLLGGLAGYGITLGIFLLAEVFSRLLHRLRGQALDEVAFGGGDVNLAGIIGLAVGWPGIILSLMIAVLAGGVFSFGYIVVQVIRRRYVPYSAVPYGPFLVLGAVAIYFYGKDLAAAWLVGH
jgi:prepilin signal peptidase PulO-like enzyme (type II secretory pathway)